MTRPSSAARFSGAYASGAISLVIMSSCPDSSRSSSALWSGMISTTRRSRYGSAAPSGALREVARVAREDEALSRHVLAAATNGPSPTISDGGVSRPHAFPNVPALSAPSSLWRGRIGRLSSRRTPGANGAGKVMTTVCGSVARDLELLAAGLQRVGQRAAALLVVHRLERKQHIVGRERVAVGEDDVALSVSVTRRPSSAASSSRRATARPPASPG